MTSSLKSKFDFAKRRAMFASAHKMAVYHWHKGDLGSSYLFDVNSDGRLYFERYLRETPGIPVYFLVDVFEEEFRRDTAPHVYGADRQAIIERKKARLFRDTPYYSYRVQGREAEGRKDDQILLSAITNHELVSPWIKLLEQYKVPLVGIYSIPLLTENLVKQLPEAGENNLIVSIQSISGLRQTFISSGQLRVSRLIQLPRYGTEPYGPHIKEEVDKIKRYLNSVRLIPTDVTDKNALRIYFLLTGDVLEEMKKEYSDQSTAGMYFLDINEILETSGSERRVSSPFSDQLFVHQLLKSRPANIYARPRERRYNSMRNFRNALLACSALMMVSSLVWSGITLMQGIGLRQNTLAAQNKTDFYNTRYQIAREGLPQTPVEPADLKVAVELIDKLEAYKTSPLEMVRAISIAMNSYPTIKLGRFEWVSAADPNLRIGDTVSRSNTRNQGVVGYSGVTTAEQKYDYYQIAAFEAEISPFDGNYRRAISLINEFAETIRDQAGIYDVSITSLPLDVSSDASMTGNTKMTQREARFSMRIVLGLKNEV